MSGVSVPLADLLRDRYTIEHELAQGGMAVVYLAQDLEHGRPVALKVLRPGLAASLGPDRFLREIQLTATLEHPNILSLLDSGNEAGQLWYTMPYVEGETLRQLLSRELQLPVDEAVRITREIAQALDHAHRHGIVHRDVKPENILLAQGRVLVGDFGIAKALGQAAGQRLTESGLVVGTLPYMSPEQAAGLPVDARTDIFALGCVLYEMLAGELPFSGATGQAMIAKRLAGAPPSLRITRPDVPAAVDAAMQRALAPAPAARFSTADELARALAEPLVAAAVPAPSPRRASGPMSAGATVVIPRQPSRQNSRGRRVPVAVAAAIVVAVLLALLAVWFTTQPGS
jgi:serine/threonine-protein kinase